MEYKVLLCVLCANLIAHIFFSKGRAPSTTEKRQEEKEITNHY